MWGALRLAELVSGCALLVGVLVTSLRRKRKTQYPLARTHGQYPKPTVKVRK